jgi:hypothetical protein
VDIRKFYLLVSRELRSTIDHGSHIQLTKSSRFPAAGNGDTSSTTGDLLNLAIEWLRVMAEEQTRVIISRVSSGLLMADRLSSEIPEVRSTSSPTRTDLMLGQAQTTANEWTGAADGLAVKIYDTIAARTVNYGISVEEVSLQEIRLPEEIVQQCVEACKAAYLPLLAQREASRTRAQLAAEVELLGREAVGTREVVGAAPAFGVADFVSQFLSKRLADPAGLGLAAASAALGTPALAVKPQPPVVP